jgi:hypothetical protein
MLGVVAATETSGKASEPTARINVNNIDIGRRVRRGLFCRKSGKENMVKSGEERGSDLQSFSVVK